MTEGLRWAHLRRDALCVVGPDAVTYLQGQLSQDVASLEVGGSAWSWLLQPAGKVDALVRVTRTGPEALLVDVDGGYGEAVLNRLTRFKLRTRAEIGHVGIMAYVARGPGAVAAVAERVARDHEVDPVTIGLPEGTAAALAVAALWRLDEEAADLLLLVHRNMEDLPPDAPSEPERIVAGVPVMGWTPPGVSEGPAWEAERIVAGVPVMGAELTEKTIPAETGLVEITASFTKGCYTGQELVARIDSRGGNVPRHLRALRSAEPLTAGDELADASGKVVGSVTSAAVHPALGPVALGYVGRAVAPGDAVVGPKGEVLVLAIGGAGD